ncbi:MULTISPECIES: hypothetical protein [Pontibacillus]|uniref:DUF4911 domain-containing protein n=1 Tax=Pontibacillus chungwhensis TaxID=265426 RepID=A0ABY8UT12_9BACI|nr:MULTISPECIES: hypothetical protein [Pontibacillus]MCD5323436.1 hypothetical protein [Pontibacillus sp. HN14]WIF96816.1 hypothetical protein QNI29_13770 [Pontibacillus chungwhensis]
MNTERSPLDYSGERFPVYFEVSDLEAVYTVLESLQFVGQIEAREHGYIVSIAMQQIPEVVRTLAQENIAIYAVIPDA